MRPRLARLAALLDSRLRRAWLPGGLKSDSLRIKDASRRFPAIADFHIERRYRRRESGNAELAASGEIYFVGEDSRQETEDGRMNRMSVSAPVFRLLYSVLDQWHRTKETGRLHFPFSTG